MIVVFCFQKTWFSGRSPAYPIHRRVVSYEMFVAPFIILTSWKHMNITVGTACRQNKAVFPGGPLNAIHTWAHLLLEGKLPVIDLDFLPYFDGFIISTGSDHVLELWMCPWNLPAGSGVGLKLSYTLRNDLFTFHFANLYEPITVTSR